MCESQILSLTEYLQVVAFESNSLIHMLQKTTGRRDENVHARQTFSFIAEILSTDDQTSGEGVVTSNRTENFEDLNGLNERKSELQTCTDEASSIPAHE